MRIKMYLHKQLTECSIHYISSHNILESTGDLGALVICPQINLTKYGTEAWSRLDGIVQLACLVINEVSESTFKFFLTIEIEHTREETLVVIVSCVCPISVRTKVVTLPTNVLAESEPSVETIHLPSAIKCIHLLWYVFLHSLPQELSQLGIICHKPIIPPVPIHETVRFCIFVAYFLGCLHHSLAFVWRESIVENNSQSLEKDPVPRGFVGV